MLRRVARLLNSLFLTHIPVSLLQYGPGIQETLVNLTALLSSFLIVRFVAGHTFRTWILFVLFTSMHIYSNYRAVRALMLDQFNYQRLAIAAQRYISSGKVPSPEEMASLEPIFPGQDPHAKIDLGVSFRDTFTTTSGFTAAVADSTAKYVIAMEPPQSSSHSLGQVHLKVLLHRESDNIDLLKACFEALLIRQV